MREGREKERIQRDRQQKTVPQKRQRKNQGIITVFVLLIMVPVVTITGILVDVSRLKLYSSQAVMAADAYGDGILSEFDNLLKELYGLFSVTQDKEGLKAIDTLAEYAKLSFDPGGDGIGVSGFMPYQTADVEFTYEAVAGASLSNNNVLMTQISDFMKYRIIQEVLEGVGSLNTLARFNNMDADMEAMENRNDITDSCAKALGKIDEYYKLLKKLTYYPGYLDGRDEAFTSYSEKLTEIAGSDDYARYVNYLSNRTQIDAAKEKYDRIEAAAAAGGTSEAGSGSGSTEEDDESDSDEAADEDETMTAEEIALYDQYVDADEYQKSIKNQLKNYKEKAGDHSGDPTNFQNAGDIIRDLGKSEKKLREVLETLKSQIQQLNANLENCSEEIREKMKDEIRELEDIVAMADDFRETYELIETVNQDISLNEGNFQHIKEEVPKLDNVYENLLTGNVQPGDSYWAHRLSMLWYDFLEDKGEFYRQLQELCEGGADDGKGNKKAGDQERAKADKAREEAEKELEQDEVTSARDITDPLAAQLNSQGVSTGRVPGLTEYFSGGLSFNNVTAAGSKLLDKFLLTSYDFGMFSSRVSGVRPEDDEPQTEGEEEDYADYSLTKVKMSPDINYLYGAELEYLLGGHNRSVSNLNETRNIICGVRMTMNFASSYMIREVNNAIKVIANTAASAVAATGIGAAAAPLVRVAVSGALRLAFATIESVSDWKALKERESVVLLKRELGDLQTKEALESLLRINISDGSSGGDIELGYEDYLYILLCLLVEDNTLLARTSNLITLNVNQAVNSGDTLSKLDFKMADTVTAVKASCKVRMDFVVVPDRLMEMYLKGTHTESLIDVLEDQYFGYTVIRGY